MGSAEVVVVDVVAVEDLVVAAAGAVVEVEEVVEEADQEIGLVKTAVTPTLRGGRHKQFHIIALTLNSTITHCLALQLITA